MIGGVPASRPWPQAHVARQAALKRVVTGGDQSKIRRNPVGATGRVVGLQDIQAGLELEEDLNEFQMVERYDPEGRNGLKPADRSHVARVRVRGAPQV